MVSNSKKDRKYYQAVQSTQQNIPVRDFIDGIVVTNKNQYVKMLEVLPVPFFLKKISEQNKICDSFASLLKAGPSQLHFKSMAVQADLTQQINEVKKHISLEENENCKKMGNEYKNTLIFGQNEGVTRRFFVSFPYEQTNIFGNGSLESAISDLNNDANRMSAMLNGCGNDVIDSPINNPNQLSSNLFYNIYNRDKYMDEPFSTHSEAIFKKYHDYFQTDNFYIPPTEYIAPDVISYKDPKYLQINNTYYSFLYIPSYGYNPDVVCGWLDNFVNSFIGVDVDVFLKRVPKDYVITKIRNSLANSINSADDAAKTTESYDYAMQTLSSANYLKDGLSSGEDFYYLSTIITVSGQSKEEVELKKIELTKIARQMDITLNENIYECEESFNATLPTSFFDDKFMLKMRRNVLTSGASSLYPFTTFQMIDSDGLYIANDSNGSPVIVDLFDRKRFANPHVFLCGITGAGKTISLLLMALRARIKHTPVFILAPEKQNEFRRVCDAIGGQFVSIGSGSSQRINIMQIFPKDESGLALEKLIDGSNSYENASYLGEKIGTLMEFFQLHITDITLEEKQLLNEAIIATYKAKGITEDNASLWADKSRTTYKKMPIISDLVKVLEKGKETTRLARAIKLLTVGSGSHFDGQTNVDVSNDFFVIGLEHNSKDMLGLSIYMAMDYCWSKIKEDRTKNKFLFIDEWWRLAFNPIAADKSLEISKIARAYGCSMVLATQQMSDILAIENGKYGNAVLNNCATKILMSMKEKDVYSVKEMVGLTDSECNKILRFKPGQGLLIAGDNRTTLQFNPSETEKLLTFTDHDTLLKYAEMKRKEENQIVKDDIEFITAEQLQQQLNQIEKKEK